MCSKSTSQETPATKQSLSDTKLVQNFDEGRESNLLPRAQYMRVIKTLEHSFFTSSDM